MQTFYRIVAAGCLWLVIGVAAVHAADSTTVDPKMVTLGDAPATLSMYGVDVVTLHSTLLSSPPSARVEASRERTRLALEAMTAGKIELQRTMAGTSFYLDGRPTILLTPWTTTRPHKNPSMRLPRLCAAN
jgi:hypothetical protein